MKARLWLLIPGVLLAPVGLVVAGPVANAVSLVGVLLCAASLLISRGAR